MKLLTLFRPINLLLIVLTQSLIAFRFLPNFYTNWYYWTITTTLVAAAGYVINDIFDVAIDAINKPTKQIVTVILPVPKAYQLYFLLNIVAFIIAFFVQYSLLLELVVISLLLYSYARWLKKMPLIGNLLVAFLSAYSVIFPLKSIEIIIWNNQLEFFCVFAFLVSLFREIVKTIEDIEGDRAAHCKTLPILVGEKTTKFVLYFLIIVMLSFLLYSLYQNHNFVFAFYYAIIGLFLLLLTYFTYYAQNKSSYHQLSHLSKLLMLLGIIGLLI